MLLAAEPIEPIWERLMALGQSLGGNYAGSFDEREPRRLIEALARDPGRFVDRAMLVLDDPDASSDWREIFAVQFLGAARHEPAADALVARFAIDADVLRERVQDALSQIGTLSVVQKIEAFYPGKEWHVRLYADEPLARIKRPECETALLRLWEIEEADDLRVNILDGLCKLGSTARLDQSRAMIAEEPQHPELLGLAEALIAVAAMNGVGLPEEPYWRSLLARRDARAAKMTARFDALFAKELRGNWLRDGITLPARENDPDEDDAQDETDADLWDAPAMNNLAEEPIAPYRRPAPKVGRNDPCPCKSGKKYKKCCGK
ncbi:MAG TPA: SEC-C metal-binding domain-containing protein [Tepidisphaeraceae bacterium]|nr:SEC-C metal-binding domain-containing protein [Tepidisphaeraceae bacterium]